MSQKTTLKELPVLPQSFEGQWGPQAPLGNNLRVQTRPGHRAAIIPLRDGLYLVAELREQVVSQFGILPLIPVAVKVAQVALKEDEEGVSNAEKAKDWIQDRLQNLPLNQAPEMGCSRCNCAKCGGAR